MGKQLLINNKVVKIAPSSLKILSFLYNNPKIIRLDSTELSERTGIAYGGIYRYTSELVRLELISEVKDGKQKFFSISHKGKIVSRINFEQDFEEITISELEKQVENKEKEMIERNKKINKIVLKDISHPIKMKQNLSDDDIKKLDELYRIACTRRMTTNENLKAFNAILNKIKGVNL